jgi:hypothetical protein
MDDAAQALGDLAARIVVRLAVKPVDVARRRKRKRAVDQSNAPSLPNPRTVVVSTKLAVRRFGSEGRIATTRASDRVW